MPANEVSHHIIRAALKVHSALGPGLLEKAYRVWLTHELRKAGFKVAVEVELPIQYDGVSVETGFRIDMLVNDLVIIELKFVEEIARVNLAQILSYMKLSKKSLGLIMNFNVTHLKDGIKRAVEGTSWK